MEASQSHSTNNPSSNLNQNLPSVLVWPTIDGSLGMAEEESIKYARRFYKFGFALLPLLWAVNYFYFWLVLRDFHSFPSIEVTIKIFSFPKGCEINCQQEDWHTNLLACCSEPSLCMKTFFYPCGTFSKIATVARNSPMSSTEACNELMAYSLIMS